jgi:hypothetical protein
MASPNVVPVLVDDMAFSDIGCHAGEAPTPNRDRPARGDVGPIKPHCVTLVAARAA